MKRFLQLIGIGVVSATVLAIVMQFIYTFTGSEAYVLLYNVDYFPVIHVFDNTVGFGLLFHYVFCIVSVIGLYYILVFFGWQFRMIPYIVVYTVGSGILYFLTLLTDKPPAADDGEAWFYWTFSHLLYSVVVGWMVIRFVGRQNVTVQSSTHKTATHL